MIKAVLFDLDGTLLDRDASVYRFIENQYDRWFESLGHIPKMDYINRFIELDHHGYVWKDKVYQAMVVEFNLSPLSSEELFKDFLVFFKKSVVSFPNLVNTLDALQQQSIPLGMITNGKTQFQRNNIEALGIKHFFETILISEEEGIKKPDPAIFHKAARQLNVPIEECLFVGDHPVNDVKGARNAGLLSAWKRTDYYEDADAHFVIDDLYELVRVIEKHNKIIF